MRVFFITIRNLSFLLAGAASIKNMFWIMLLLIAMGTIVDIVYELRFSTPKK